MPAGIPLFPYRALHFRDVIPIIPAVLFFLRLVCLY